MPGQPCAWDFLASISARCGRGILAEPRRDAARDAQVDRQHVLLEDVRLSLELGEARQRADRRRFRAAGPRRRCPSAASSGAGRRGCRRATLSRRSPAAPRSAWNSPIRVLAPSPTTKGRALNRSSCTASMAVPSVDDQAELAVLLPHRGGVALGDVDVEVVGEQLAHRHVLDQRHGLQPVAQRRRRRAGRASCFGADAAVVQDLDRRQLTSRPEIVTASIEKPSALATMSPGVPLAATKVGIFAAAHGAVAGRWRTSSATTRTDPEAGQRPAAPRRLRP